MSILQGAVGDLTKSSLYIISPIIKGKGRQDYLCMDDYVAGRLLDQTLRAFWCVFTWWKEKHGRRGVRREVVNE